MVPAVSSASNSAPATTYRPCRPQHLVCRRSQRRQLFITHGCLHCQVQPEALEPKSPRDGHHRYRMGPLVSALGAARVTSAVANDAELLF